MARVRADGEPPLGPVRGACPSGLLAALAVPSALVAGMLVAHADGPSPGSTSAKGDGGAAPFVLTATPPDPSPMRERMQWVFDLRWERGSISLLGVTPRDMGKPVLTGRAMGRFALELFEGPTLIERVRFDFPMLGADESALQKADGGIFAHKGTRFAPGLTSRIGVLFPASPRGTRLELVDRATDQRYPLAWPPR